MAITNADGSIVLTTKVDQSGLKKGMSTMKSGVSSLVGSFGKLATAVGVAFSVGAIVKFSKEASNLATTTEASVQRLIDIYGSASKAVGDFIDANAQALGMSRAAAASYASVYGNLFSVWADQRTNAELTNAYLNMTAVVASKTGRTVEDVQERVRSGLLGNTEAIEDLGIFVNVKTIEMTDAFKRMANGKSWEQLDAYTQQQIRSMAILEQATSKYGNEVAQTTALTKAQYRAAWQDFQATWGQVVNMVLIPVLRVATKILNTLTDVLRRIADISGETIESNGNFKDQENSIQNSVDNQENLNDEIKETVKESKRLLANFDDLDILTSGIKVDEIIEDLPQGEVDNIIGTGGATTNKETINEKEYEDKLAAIGTLAGFALMGLGIILMFSGHFFIGIGLVAAGAAVYKETANDFKNNLNEETKEKLAVIGTVVGAALIALGILLLFTSHWMLGLGMIAEGALAVYTALSLGDFPENLKEKVIKILEVVGFVAIVLGVMLLFTPFWKWGLGMLAFGATAVFGILVLGEFSEDMKKKVGDILALSGEVLMVLGAILLFVPGKTLTGIAMLGAGAGAVYLGSKLSGQTLTETIKSSLTSVKNEMVEVAAIMFVLGATLLFVPGMLGVALTLLGIGASGLYMASKLDSEPFEKDLRHNLRKIQTTAEEGVVAINDTLAGIGIGEEFGVPLKNYGGEALPSTEDVVNLGFLKATALPQNPLFYMAATAPGSSPSLTTYDGYINYSPDGSGRGGNQVILEIDGRELGRAVVEFGNEEQYRVGTKLVGN